MADTAGDVLVNVLRAWGVEVIFGLPGDGINGVMEALRKRKDEIRFVQVRHEEAAAFMATAYAKFTGKLGVCLATSGPGGIHLLNGLYDAKMDRAPVVAITGHHYHDLIDTHAQQDVDLTRVFEDVAVYNTRVMSKAHVENVAELACRSALAYKGVAHICFPADLQDQTESEMSPRVMKAPHHTSNVYAENAGLPDEVGLRHAADVLNAGQKVAMLVGQGALGAGAEVEQLAELLGAPVVKALLGKAVVPDDSPYTTGTIGLLGTAPSQQVMEGCDTLLIVGSSFPYIEFYPKPDQAKAVQIDLDPQRIGLRYSVEVGLVGDSRRVLAALLPLLQRKSDRSFLEKAQSGMRDWWAYMEEQGSQTSLPMKPQVVAWELGKRLHNDAIVVSDSGTNTTWWARQIPARRGQMHSVSGTLASMACGLPYAIAAQVAHPDRQVVAFVGDGGYTMLMGELATAMKYQLPIKVVIVKNNYLGQIKWEQMVFLGNPEYEVDLQPIDFVKSAEAFGARGFRIENPADCGRILDEALATPGPVVVEAVVDPDEPPLPPKITRDQAMKFAKSLARGEPDRMTIIKNALGAKVRELV
ncbi:MAG: pyruvate oxidase [Chloroflexi bacterium]|nr:pyruvate oxidase [Chloroflexota bacterium]MBV9898729.1 pyruvate oxidase [Chloroflexota bacterium]